MNGMDLGQIMYEFATLRTGKGFTALFDQNCWLESLGEPTEEKLRYLAGQELERRMAPATEAFERLIGLALKSGVIGKSEGRITFKPAQKLTPEEEQALRETKAELAKLDTFISNPT
jgi:hypothetical protein